jgi:hypothetical protein
MATCIQRQHKQSSSVHHTSQADDLHHRAVRRVETVMMACLKLRREVHGIAGILVARWLLGFGNSLLTVPDHDIGDSGDYLD